MGREIYSAMSGGIRALKILDSVANNLANVNTTGFKADRPTFKLAAPEQSRNLNPESSEARLANSYAVLDGVSTDYSQGVLRETGRLSDLALRGEGFFHLQDAEGRDFLTRDGSFLVNAEGFLVTRDGMQVQQNTGGPIQVGQGDFRVTEQGEVKVGDDTRGTIGVVEAEAQNLSKVGGNRWILEGNQPLEQGQGQVIQKHLEASNVQAVHALTEMIAVSRYYEAFQNSLQSSSSLDQKLSSSVGKINQ
ncbi:MAG: hypothetical protein CMP23_17480 [Rickettsiales bacterium]|nr:hypothetical protein [Rickettsiales bacterium]